MALKHRKMFFTMLGLSISIVFLWLAFRKSNLDEIRNAMNHANWLFAPLVVVTLAVYFGFKTLRWKQLLIPIARIKTSSLYSVVVVGYAANLILPAQMGELVRTYLAGQKFMIPSAPVFITVVLERMFDFLAIMLFIGFLLPITKNVPPELILAGYVCATIGLLMLSVVVTHIMRPAVFTGVVKSMVRMVPLPYRKVIIDRFDIATIGLESLRDPRRFMFIAMNSLIQWLLMGICTFFAIAALQIDVPISAAFIVLAVVVVGMTIPSSPGFFGTIQFCFTIGLAPFGIAPGPAIAASIYFHGLLFISVAVGGLAFVRFLGYTPHGLVQASEVRSSEP